MEKLVGGVKRERNIILLISLSLMTLLLAANAFWTLGRLYRIKEDKPKYLWVMLCDYVPGVLKIAIIDVYMLV